MGRRETIGPEGIVRRIIRVGQWTETLGERSSAIQQPRGQANAAGSGWRSLIRATRASARQFRLTVQQPR